MKAQTLAIVASLSALATPSGSQEHPTLSELLEAGWEVRDVVQAEAPTQHVFLQDGNRVYRCALQTSNGRSISACLPIGEPEAVAATESSPDAARDSAAPDTSPQGLLLAAFRDADCSIQFDPGGAEFSPEIIVEASFPSLIESVGTVEDGIAVVDAVNQSYSMDTARLVDGTGLFVIYGLEGCPENPLAPYLDMIE